MGFDTTPKPYFLTAVRNQSWHAMGAIAEFIDNSFGPARGDASTCWIVYNPTKKTLTVTDDGNGMTSIGRLFQLGNGVGHAIGDIGRYGAGGTMALLWLGDTVKVTTLRDGMVASDSVFWNECIKADRFPEIDDGWRRASFADCPPELLAHKHGTQIAIRLSDKRGKLNASHIKRDLAKIYSPGIRAGKRIVWTTEGRNGGTDILTDPIVMPGDDDKVVNFEFVIERGDEYLPVRGQVGLLDEMKVTDSGVHIGYGYRILTKTKDCFASPDGSKRHTAATVTGWLDLGDGWQPYLSTTKTGIDDQPLWDTLMAHVYERIEPLLEEADDERLTLHLEDIALSLNHLFEGSATVSVARNPVQVPAIDSPLGDQDDITERKMVDDPDLDDEGGTEQREKPARTTIEIIKMSDSDLDGVLCRADRANNNISVYVNRDHPLIQEALRQHPVNRMCLHMVVVNEIANMMAVDPDLCELAFKPRIAAELLEEPDVSERHRRLIRLMADNIPLKQAS